MSSEPKIRDSKLDLSKLSEAAEDARKEMATWPEWKQKLVKYVHDHGWKYNK